MISYSNTANPRLNLLTLSGRYDVSSGLAVRQFRSNFRFRYEPVSDWSSEGDSIACHRQKRSHSLVHLGQRPANVSQVSLDAALLRCVGSFRDTITNRLLRVRPQQAHRFAGLSTAVRPFGSDKLVRAGSSASSEAAPIVTEANKVSQRDFSEFLLCLHRSFTLSLLTIDVFFCR